jgi:hypothetical protein
MFGLTKPRTDFHQLEAGLELLDQHVRPDRGCRQLELRLECRQHVVPERRFFCRLNLGQIEDD